MHVEPVLEQLFSTIGVPLIYKTDNESSLQSYKFAEFATRMGYKHRLISPHWLRANGEVEGFMRGLGEALRIAKLSGMRKLEVVRQYLKVYRDTPRCTNKIPPNILMFGFSRSSESFWVRDRRRGSGLAQAASQLQGYARMGSRTILRARGQRLNDYSPARWASIGPKLIIFQCWGNYRGTNLKPTYELSLVDRITRKTD